VNVDTGDYVFYAKRDIYTFNRKAHELISNPLAVRIVNEVPVKTGKVEVGE
jgi:hypothetical protein